MPVVRITHKDGNFTTYTRETAQILPEIVASALSTSEGGTIETEGVTVLTHKSRSLMDVNVPDILIEISAHNFAERMKKIDEIPKTVKDAVSTYLSGRSQTPKITVILSLVPMSFA